jgi:hypothetical protein
MKVGPKTQIILATALGGVGFCAIGIGITGLGIALHRAVIEVGEVLEFFGLLALGVTSYLLGERMPNPLWPIAHRTSRQARVAIGSISGEIGRLPRAWDLLQYLFSRKIRDEIYEPAKEDLRQDWALGRPKFPSGLPRMLFDSFMFLRTVVLLAECMRVAMSRPLGRLVPGAVKALWRMFS